MCSRRAGVVLSFRVERKLKVLSNTSESLQILNIVVVDSNIFTRVRSQTSRRDFTFYEVLVMPGVINRRDLQFLTDTSKKQFYSSFERHQRHQTLTQSQTSNSPV